MTDRDLLRSYVERVQGYDSDAKLANEGKRDVYKEARGQGYDPQAIKDLVAYLRDPEKAQTRSAAFDGYLALLNQPTKNNAPPRNSVSLKGHPSLAHAREEKIEKRPTATQVPIAQSAAPAAKVGAVGTGDDSLATSLADDPLSIPLALRRDPDNSMWQR